MLPSTLSSTSSAGVTRKIVDHSEDSGFSSIISGGSIEAENNEKTIGDGIIFANPNLIEEEQKRIEAEKKIKNQQKQIEKIAAEEAYEKQIQEQQYKGLMHLLSESKTFAKFLLEKPKEKQPKGGRKRGRKSLKSQNDDKENGNDSPPAKRSRQAKNNIPNKILVAQKRNGKLNISNEAIEDLQTMSNNESIDNKKEKKINLNNFVQPKYFIGELRDYQKEGLNWLKKLYENGLNGILADEMGLGKTIQVIALFAHLFENQVPGPYLVIVPLSTLPNWTSEFKRFAPELPVVVYYGSRKGRVNIRKDVQQKVEFSKKFRTLPIVLMTYEAPVYDKSFLKTFEWRFIVIDEAQRIKNFECQLIKIVKSWKSYNRLLLTGTPLQNNLAELWSLLNFLLPDIFNNLEVFQSWFDAKEVQNEVGRKKFFQQEQEKNVIGVLREILQPFMLRRLKEDVCPDVPPLKEIMIYTPLTIIQYDLYSAILNKDIYKLKKIKEPSIVDVNSKRQKRKCTEKVTYDELLSLAHQSKNEESKLTYISKWKQFAEVTEENSNYLIRIKMTNKTVMYRHVVNHPYLIHYPVDIYDKVDNSIIKASGKLLVLDAMLKRLKSKGHKVLLFSSMRMVLDIIEDYLSLRDYLYVRLDGYTKCDEREKVIHEFQTNPEVFLFLLTTKAGAVGLNLAAADTVIIYDSDWNPQNDLQAMARCHRIGQTKPVVAYRFCCKGSIDEIMIKRASAKRVLEKAVISKQDEYTVSKADLLQLKKLFEEDSVKVVDSKSEVYTDAELDALLDRSDMVSS